MTELIILLILSNVIDVSTTNKIDSNNKKCAQIIQKYKESQVRYSVNEYLTWTRLNYLLDNSFNLNNIDLNYSKRTLFLHLRMKNIILSYFLKFQELVKINLCCLNGTTNRIWNCIIKVGVLNVHNEINKTMIFSSSANLNVDCVSIDCKLAFCNQKFVFRVNKFNFSEIHYRNNEFKFYLMGITVAYIVLLFNLDKFKNLIFMSKYISKQMYFEIKKSNISNILTEIVSIKPYNIKLNFHNQAIMKSLIQKLVIPYKRMIWDPGINHGKMVTIW